MTIASLAASCSNGEVASTCSPASGVRTLWSGVVHVRLQFCVGPLTKAVQEGAGAVGGGQDLVVPPDPAVACFEVRGRAAAALCLPHLGGRTPLPLLGRGHLPLLGLLGRGSLPLSGRGFSSVGARGQLPPPFTPCVHGLPVRNRCAPLLVRLCSRPRIESGRLSHCSCTWLRRGRVHAPSTGHWVGHRRTCRAAT